MAVLGLDVGATKTAIGWVEGTALSDIWEHVTAGSDPAGVVDGLEALVRAAGGSPDAIGIGLPSGIEAGTGRVLWSGNLPLEGIPVGPELERRLGVPVATDNDATCAALAEAVLRGAQHLVALTLGTGVGGGLIIHGRPYGGASGMGGELGHWSVNADGPPCPGNCPNRGCLEALCSGQALARDAAALVRGRPHTALAAHGPAPPPRDVVALARAGDPDATALLARLGRWLGVGIAGLVNAFAPEVVVIGGGLADAGELVLGPARGEAEGRTLSHLLPGTRIETAVAGVHAGVLGAGTLAAQRLP